MKENEPTAAPSLVTRTPPARASHHLTVSAVGTHLPYNSKGIADG